MKLLITLIKFTPCRGMCLKINVCSLIRLFYIASRDIIFRTKPIERCINHKTRANFPLRNEHGYITLSMRA
jgi:hypothetical protein